MYTESITHYDSPLDEPVIEVVSYKLRKDGTRYKRPHSSIAYTQNVRVKRCSKCDKWKGFYVGFRDDRYTKDGKHGSCKSCEAAYFAKYDRTERGQKRFKKRLKLEQSIEKAAPEYKEELRRRFGYACAFTGESGDIVLDHVLPISSVMVTKEVGNLLPISAKLNRQKRNRSIFEFVEELDPFLQHRFYTFILPFLASENGMTEAEYIEHMREAVK